MKGRACGHFKRRARSTRGTLDSYSLRPRLETAAPNAAGSKTSQRQVARGARPRRRGAMLLLFETAAGHALYELKHEEKLKKLDADKLASKLSEPCLLYTSPSPRDRG